MIRSFCLLLLALASVCARAQGELPSEPSYYRDAERGWHWYETQPDPPPPPKPEKPKFGGGQGSGAAPLSAAWLREQLPRYRDLALDAPTPANVELYYMLQRLSVDKAERFANVAGNVVARNAFLDESNERPVTQLGKAAARQARNADRESALSAVRDHGVGIFYFYRHDCGFCMRFGPVLAMLKQLHGLRILPISLDGLPLQDGSFPDFVVDEGQAAQLQVRVTPTLFLARRNETPIPLTTGLRTLDELEDKILLIARDEGWIDDAQYAGATRGTQPTFLSEQVEADPSLPTDPEALLEVLRAATTSSLRGAGTPWITPENVQ